MACVRLCLGRLIAALPFCVLAACSTGRFSESTVEYTDPISLPGRARVAVVGDLQRTGSVETWRENNDKHRPSIVAGIVADAPDALIVLGDLVWWGSSVEDWSYFDTLMSPVRRSQIPVLPVIGNHDYYGSAEKARKNFLQRFPWFAEDGMVRVIDSVAYVILNTNFGEVGAKGADKQRRWFVSTLRSLDANDGVLAIVVCGHHPPFTNSTVVDPDYTLQSYFVPSFLYSPKSAAWLSGHAHTYERFSVDGRLFVVSGGGGGPRQTVANASRTGCVDHYEGAALRPLHHLLVERVGRLLCIAMRPLTRDVSVPVTADAATVRIGGGPIQFVNNE